MITEIKILLKIVLSKIFSLYVTVHMTNIYMIEEIYALPLLFKKVDFDCLSLAIVR